MKYILVFSFCAAVALVMGCDGDNPPSHEPYVSRSCDAIAIDANNHVLAAINSVGTYGHLEANGPLDDQPAPPDYAAVLRRYDGFGNQRDNRDFWNDWSGEFAMRQIGGIKPISGEQILVVGEAGRLVSAIVDSSFRYELAQYWGNEAYGYTLKCAPAGEYLACFYSDYMAGTGHRLAFLSNEGDVISDYGDVDTGWSYPPPKLVGLSTGNVLVVDGYVVSEYAPMNPDPEWVVNGASRKFGAAGEDLNGNPILFGTFEPDTTHHELAVVLRTSDSTEFRTCYVSGIRINEVSAAARTSDSTWLIACVTYPNEQFVMLEYNGSDTVNVVGGWITDGEPVTTCAAASGDGWVVFGGHVDHPEDPGRQDAFVRTYSSAGTSLWSDIINGE